MPDQDTERYSLTFEQLCDLIEFAQGDQPPYAGVILNNWRTARSITPQPAPAAQNTRDAAFVAALDLARGERLPPPGLPLVSAIARIQLAFCDHGDGTPGEFEPWMNSEALPVAEPAPADAVTEAAVLAARKWYAERRARNVAWTEREWENAIMGASVDYGRVPRSQDRTASHAFGAEARRLVGAGASEVRG